MVETSSNLDFVGFFCVFIKAMPASICWTFYFVLFVLSFAFEAMLLVVTLCFRPDITYKADWV